MQRSREAESDRLIAKHMQQKAALWERECSVKETAYLEAKKVNQQLSTELDDKQRLWALERGRWTEVSGPYRPSYLPLILRVPPSAT